MYTAIDFRDLDPKLHNMIAILSNTPREKFRCYNTTSQQKPVTNTCECTKLDFFEIKDVLEFATSLGDKPTTKLKAGPPKKLR